MQKVQTTISISVQDIQKELKRIHKKHHNRSIVKNTLIFLLSLVAVSVLLANFWLPVLRVFGTSMEPTLKQGDTVIAMKTNRIKQGDLIAFYFNNRMLVKRVIGLPGDAVDIDKKDQVSVNGKINKSNKPIVN